MKNGSVTRRHERIMPELPEVETVARTIAPQIVGRSFTRIEILDWERMVETPPIEDFRHLIVGRRVEAVGRRAKWLIITLDAGWSLAIHLRMSGTLFVAQSNETLDKHTHLVLGLDDGRRFCFRDIRKFGRVRLVDQTGLQQLDLQHGLEPLSESFTPQALAELLAGRSTKIKALLLDQSRIAGLGNIYTDEALWRSRINPTRAAGSLSKSEIEALHEAICYVLRLGIHYGGSTLRDFRNGFGERGQTQEHFTVYGRKNQPCERCGSLIERIIVAQRSTHFCPECQPKINQT